MGELKKFSPTSSIAFEYVYETRKLPHFPGRCTKETCNPSYQESAAGEYWPIWRNSGQAGTRYYSPMPRTPARCG